MVRDQSRVAFIAVTEIKTSTSPIIFPPPLAWIAPNPAAGVGRFGRFAIRVILIDLAIGLRSLGREELTLVRKTCHRAFGTGPMVPPGTRRALGRYCRRSSLPCPPVAARL